LADPVSGTQSPRATRGAKEAVLAHRVAHRVAQGGRLVGWRRATPYS